MARAMLCEPYSYTVLSVTQVGNGGIENIKNDEPGLLYRASSTGNVGIELDLGAASAIGAMAVLGCPVASGSTRWRGAASQAALTSSPGYDSGTVSLGLSSNRTATLAKSLHVPSTPQSFRYWRLDINPSSGFAELWRLLLCKKMQPVENIEIGADLSVDDRSLRRYSRSGRRIIDPTVIVPAFQGRWPWITRSEFESDWRPFLLRGGATKPALFVLDSGDTTWGEDAMYYGDLEKSNKLVYEDGDVFSYNLAIVSIAP